MSRSHHLRGSGHQLFGEHRSGIEPADLVSRGRRFVRPDEIHQVGSFSGVWLGGYLYARFGSYLGIWVAGMVLGLVAAWLHLPIREQHASHILATADPTPAA